MLMAKDMSRKRSVKDRGHTCGGSMKISLHGVN